MKVVESVYKKMRNFNKAVFEKSLIFHKNSGKKNAFEGFQLVNCNVSKDENHQNLILKGVFEGVLFEQRGVLFEQRDSQHQSN